ncbi:MAG: phosphoribosyltransferase family protein [Pseudomonadota bacterium]|jgi:putative phosphoribosyl transferase
MLRLPFADRLDAAAQLAPALAHLRDRHPLVLAIPRGAVPMGREIARLLGADFDVVMVRKLGAPDNPEFAVGAVDESGHAWVATHAAAAGADPGYLARAIAAERRTMRTRRARWSPGRASCDPAGRTVIVVDDGLATGATMRVALDAVRRRRPAWLVCAVPVAAADSLAEIQAHCDEIACLHAPRAFDTVGSWYRHFEQVSDDAVAACLADEPVDADTDRPAPADHDAGGPVRIALDDVVLDGDLALPDDARGLVVFAHGSGSSRLSPRNRRVAAVLQRRRLATLLLDLLTPTEDRFAAQRFDIGLLSRRVRGALAWAQSQPALCGLPVGLFGASTGAAAAIEAAADPAIPVAAVVSRGGRPDLASPQALAQLRAPLLLLVGGADHEVLSLNRQALAAAGGPAEMRIAPDASHLFEEPGALEEVAAAAADWFNRHLCQGNAESE